jgi:hypothetical protein
MSPELKAFKEHFKANCSVKVTDTVENKSYFHWKRLCFNSLNCEELLQIAQYIKNTFSNTDNDSHLRLKLHIYDDGLCLTVDVSDIKDKILKV